MTKLLIHSNAPWAPTGYGAQTGLFAPRLAEHYEVAISAFYGLEGAAIRWKDVPVLPGLGGEFGNAYLVDHARNYFDDDPRGGVVLTLMDVWVLQAMMVAQMNVCSWVPVDHHPTPPAITQFFKESGSIPIAMSRFGQEQLEAFDPLYVPHAVDVKAYRPHPRAEVREAFGLPEGGFIVGMVAANKGRPSRKGFQQAFEAFRALRKKHDNAYLYLHTGMNPDHSQGEDLATMLASLEIPAEAILIANQYRINFSPAAPETMGRLYSAFDVLLNPAMGEGFGVPILEAQACGIPAIVTDFSAMKEVCAAGWKVGCSPFWTGQRSWQATPDVKEIYEALEAAYSQSTNERKAMSAAAEQHALKYRVERVLEKFMLPALAKVEERFAERANPKVKVAA